MQTKSVQICLMPTKKSMLVVWAPFHLPTFSWFRNRAMASFVGLRLKQLLSAKTVEQPTGHVVGRRGSCVFFVCGSSGNELLGEGGWLDSWLIDCLSLPCLRIMILTDSCVHHIYIYIHLLLERRHFQHSMSSGSARRQVERGCQGARGNRCSLHLDEKPVKMISLWMLHHCLTFRSFFAECCQLKFLFQAIFFWGDGCRNVVFHSFVGAFWECLSCLCSDNCRRWQKDSFPHD